MVNLQSGKFVPDHRQVECQETLNQFNPFCFFYETRELRPKMTDLGPKLGSLDTIPLNFLLSWAVSQWKAIDINRSTNRFGVSKAQHAT